MCIIRFPPYGRCVAARNCETLAHTTMHHALQKLNMTTNHAFLSSFFYLLPPCSPLYMCLILVFTIVVVCHCLSVDTQRAAILKPYQCTTMHVNTQSRIQSLVSSFNKFPYELCSHSLCVFYVHFIIAHPRQVEASLTHTEERGFRVLGLMGGEREKAWGDCAQCLTRGQLPLHVAKGRPFSFMLTRKVISNPFIALSMNNNYRSLLVNYRLNNHRDKCLQR